MTQSFSPLVHDERITEPFGGISVISLGNGRTLLQLHAAESHLHVIFEKVHAVAIHEEFAHPHVDADGDYCMPALPGRSGGYPILIVHDSDWIKTFSDVRLLCDGQIPFHYQFLSFSYFVDVLSYEPPQLEWVPADAFERLFSGFAP